MGFTKGNALKLTHGLSKSHEYLAWQGMLYRRYNQKFKQYADYGGRGIGVCDQWRKSFEAFYADMGPRPSNNHSIERLNNSLGYSPKNCTWADKVHQQRNTRRNHLLQLNGETMPISAWAEKTGISKNTILKRIRTGWTERETLTTPVDIKMRNKRSHALAHEGRA